MPTDVYINHGSDPAANTFKSWNQGNLANISNTVSNLVDDSGTGTGWDVVCTAARGGISATGVNAVGTGDAAWVDEAAISDQFEYAIGTTVVSYRFDNLDNSKTYNITIFSSWSSGSGSRILEFSLDNFSTTADSVEARGNSSNVAQATNISPSSGSIEVYFRAGGGTSYGHHNAVWLRENDAAAGGIVPAAMANYLNMMNG